MPIAGDSKVEFLSGTIKKAIHLLLAELQQGLPLFGYRHPGILSVPTHVTQIFRNFSRVDSFCNCMLQKFLYQLQILRKFSVSPQNVFATSALFDKGMRLLR